MSAGTVLAAGTVPWRRKKKGRLQVALVHRPKYDDWSWPKGKLDADEGFPEAAVRETFEETGLRVGLGHPLPSSEYLLGDGATPKTVRYWAAEVIGGDGRLRNEVDRVDWLDIDTAIDRLTQRWDRDQARALVDADVRGALATWPLVVVRHAHAHDRGSHRGEDHLRPLDDRGREQARQLVPLLDAYGIRRVVSSPSTRAAETLAPFATAQEHKLRRKKGLSEEGHAADPTRAGHHLRRLLDRGEPAVLCSHRTVLPDVLRPLLERVDSRYTASDSAASLVTAALEGGLAKGETLIAHVAGTGGDARVVAAERHRPGERD